VLGGTAVVLVQGAAELGERLGLLRATDGPSDLLAGEARPARDLVPELPHFFAPGARRTGVRDAGHGRADVGLPEK
jgi:hypothetical protein